MEILGIGVATLDIINFTEHYPGPDEEMRALAQQRRLGGNVANTLSVLSQFGHRCRWLGVLGDDDGAQFIANQLRDSHVQVETAGHVGGVSPTSYIIVSQQDSSRNIVHYRELPELSFDQFKQVSLQNVEYCHFEGRHAQETLKMLSYLKQHYPQIPYSVEFEKPRPDLDLLGEAAELIFYSKHYANALGFSDATTFLKQQSAASPQAWLICTWGNNGCYFRHASDSADIRHVPTLMLPEVIDSVGAGDTFIAGFLQQWWKTRDAHSAAKFANQLAAKKCSQLGFEGLASDKN